MNRFVDAVLCKVARYFASIVKRGQANSLAFAAAVADSKRVRDGENMQACSVINIERGMPTVETARTLLSQGLRNAKASRTAVVKVIHGYGSSGKGGAIKADVLRTLQQKCISGQIVGYVRGEDFSAFDATTRQMLERCPALARDLDYGRQNHGITMVLL